VKRFTTIVLLVSPRASELVSDVAADATNVTAVRIGDAEGASEAERRRDAWSEARRRRNVYTLIDFDPLTELIEAWNDRLRGRDQSLEAVVGTVDADTLAEYVFVADDVEGEIVHWYHGLLRRFAPRRVLTVRSHPASILDALAHLRPSPALPNGDVIAQAALEYVPTGISAERAVAPMLLPDR
jgi:hypothetical protein